MRAAPSPTTCPLRSPASRGGENGGARRVGRAARLAAVFSALVVLLAGCDNGNRLYREGEYRKAAEAYDSARAHLEAALPAGGPEVRQRASYNAGNADLVPVFLRRVPDDQRRPRLERAVAAYQRALLLRPGDLDAKWNLEIALRLLALQPQGGGGGGEDEGGGGEEEGEQQAPEAAERAPQGAKGMTPSEAERILRGAQRAEAEVQGEKLRREQPRGRVLRDW